MRAIVIQMNKKYHFVIYVLVAIIMDLVITFEKQD